MRYFENPWDQLQYDAMHAGAALWADVLLEKISENRAAGHTPENILRWVEERAFETAHPELEASDG